MFLPSFPSSFLFFPLPSPYSILLLLLPFHRHIPSFSFFVISLLHRALSSVFCPPLSTAFPLFHPFLSPFSFFSFLPPFSLLFLAELPSQRREQAESVAPGIVSRKWPQPRAKQPRVAHSFTPAEHAVALLVRGSWKEEHGTEPSQRQSDRGGVPPVQGSRDCLSLRLALPIAQGERAVQLVLPVLGNFVAVFIRH